MKLFPRAYAYVKKKEYSKPQFKIKKVHIKFQTPDVKFTALKWN